MSQQRRRSYDRPSVGKPGQKDVTFKKSEADRLFEAIESNEVETVRKLVALPTVQINGRDRYGRTPIYLAVEKGLGEIARILLLHGADPSSETSNRSTAVDLARDTDCNDIGQLIYNVVETMWKPGDDPELLYMQRELVGVDLKDREMTVIEKSQIQDILEGAQLGEYFTLFDQEKITFLDFLRVDDHCLKTLGISEAEDRAKICQLVKEMSERKWERGDNLPLFMRKDVSSFEITCILKNIRCHTNDIQAALYHAIDQISNKPETLRMNLEAMSMVNIYESVERIQNQIQVFVQSVNEFSSFITRNQTGGGLGLNFSTLIAMTALISIASGSALWLCKLKK